MRAELEQIDIESTNQSIQFFTIETQAFAPYWHYHPEIELTFILEGEGTRIVGNSIETFTSNDLVLVGKNIPHHWISLNQEVSNLQKAYVFQFSANIFSSFKECEHFGALFKIAQRGIQFKEPTPKIIQLITTFATLNKVQQLVALIDLLHQLTQHEPIKVLASKDYKFLQHQKHDMDKFAKVNNYILEHLDQKLTVQQLADVTNMVPQSFCRWFRQHSGYSFITFLNTTRIENACQLLLHKTESIQRIAFSSGFESLSHFNRTFKKYKQQSPREFMNSK
ncbi:AraC family transcriptional regulator [Paucihalobacter ruber]|uniref:AraC family transcriptional regulator n=1 Tax=Paucihalobacter ruber TaxID=2567861 RepID=A0A506PQ52_9FLAO|nr:AraC family transcriptional regulator [Paucihalobacter ruber]TPV35357.1 AraC family transcriptional regulator [Paucihalobacter ruber]